MSDYRLQTDGDSLEREYWYKFIETKFPHYEIFWQKFVVPITNRPANIYIKSDQELKKINKTPNDVYLSQLHYTILKHLARVYDILHETGELELKHLVEGMSRICGTIDGAHELLQRVKEPIEYIGNDPWDIKGYKISISARKKYEKNERLLEKISNYRNHLIHGNLLPSLRTNDNFLHYPKIGKQENYFDWRKITDPNNRADVNEDDFISVKQILWDAWNETLRYLENKWKSELINNMDNYFGLNYTLAIMGTPSLTGIYMSVEEGHNLSNSSTFTAALSGSCKTVSPGHRSKPLFEPASISSVDSSSRKKSESYSFDGSNTGNSEKYIHSGSGNIVDYDSVENESDE